MAAGTITKETKLLFLDAIFHLALRAINLVVESLGATFQIGQTITRISAFEGVFGFRNDPAFPVPTLERCWLDCPNDEPQQLHATMHHPHDPVPYRFDDVVFLVNFALHFRLNVTHLFGVSLYAEILNRNFEVSVEPVLEPGPTQSVTRFSSNPWVVRATVAAC
jgi:hypothetical protein